MPPTEVRAAVMVAPWVMELRSFPLPSIGELGGILRVEASGVCGADIHYYSESTRPRILGHEVVGTIMELGAQSAEAWGLTIGDRVAVEEYLPCGHCDFCRSSEFRLCLASDPSAAQTVMRYGSTTVDVPPSLWGGYAEHMYLHPRSVVHRAPADVPAHLLAMALPIGNGYEWTVAEGAVRPGQSVVVLGPGQQGLGCVVAAKEAGASTIVVVGLTRDELRLDVAKQLGATHVLRGDSDDIVKSVLDITSGVGVDVVIDAAAGNEYTVPAGLQMVRKRGTFILPTGDLTPVPVPLGLIQSKYLTVKGVRGHSFASVEWALRMLACDQERFELMCTHTFGLDEVDLAIRTLAARGGSEQSIHVTVLPNI